MLGVLATLVVPKVVNIKANAEEKVDAANEKIIKNALERYYAEKGEYPSNDDGLNKLVTENYLDDIPDKVKSGTWSYTLNSDGKSYELK